MSTNNNNKQTPYKTMMNNLLNKMSKHGSKCLPANPIRIFFLS